MLVIIWLINFGKLIYLISSRDLIWIPLWIKGRDGSRRSISIRSIFLILLRNLLLYIYKEDSNNNKINSNNSNNSNNNNNHHLKLLDLQLSTINKAKIIIKTTKNNNII